MTVSTRNPSSQGSLESRLTGIESAERYQERKLNELLKVNYNSLSEDTGDQAVIKSIAYILDHEIPTHSPIFLKRLTKVAALGLRAGHFDPPEFDHKYEFEEFKKQKVEFLERLFEYNDAGAKINYSTDSSLTKKNKLQLKSHFHNQAAEIANRLFDLTNESRFWGDNAIKNYNKAAEIAKNNDEQIYAISCYRSIINLSKQMSCESSNPARYMETSYKAFIQLAKIHEKDLDIDLYIKTTNATACLAEKIYSLTNNKKWLKHAKSAYKRIIETSSDRISKAEIKIQEKAHNRIESVIYRLKKH